MIKKTFSIGDVEKLTGVSQKQIRYYEAKGYIPFANRIVYGERSYRRFSLKQVEIISLIKTYRDEGLTLSTAAEKAKQMSSSCNISILEVLPK